MTTPTLRTRGANWAIGFIDYGAADPERCDAALDAAVRKLQETVDIG